MKLINYIFNVSGKFRTTLLNLVLNEKHDLVTTLCINHFNSTIRFYEIFNSIKIYSFH